MEGKAEHFPAARAGDLVFLARFDGAAGHLALEMAFWASDDHVGLSVSAEGLYGG
jgi:hypothetical protein